MVTHGEIIRILATLSHNLTRSIIESAALIVTVVSWPRLLVVAIFELLLLFESCFTSLFVSFSAVGNELSKLN